MWHILELVGYFVLMVYGVYDYVPILGAMWQISRQLVPLVWWYMVATIISQFRVQFDIFCMALDCISWCGIVLHGIEWSCMAWCGVAWHCIALHGIACHGVAGSDMALPSVVWHWMSLCGVALDSVAWYGMAWHCLALHDISWRCMTWHVIACHGLSLHCIGVAWHCML